MQPVGVELDMLLHECGYEEVAVVVTVPHAAGQALPCCLAGRDKGLGQQLFLRVKHVSGAHIEEYVVKSRLAQMLDQFSGVVVLPAPAPSPRYFVKAFTPTDS